MYRKLVEEMLFLLLILIIEDLDDVKSDLNGTFQKFLEAKWKTVEIEVKESVSVKIISNKKQQLQENQILMKVSRSENRHGLVQDIVYFLNKNSKVVNSKLVLRYYINKKVCGNVEIVEYTVPSHGNSEKRRHFMLSKRVLYLTVKTIFFPVVANVLLVFCTISSVKVSKGIIIMGISQDLKSNSLTFAGHNMQIMKLEIY